MSYLLKKSKKTTILMAITAFYFAGVLDHVRCLVVIHKI